jgi:hypothetical protein
MIDQEHDHDEIGVLVNTVLVGVVSGNWCTSTYDLEPKLGR